jgi:hypothetical protein
MAHPINQHTVQNRHFAQTWCRVFESAVLSDIFFLAGFAEIHDEMEDGMKTRNKGSPRNRETPPNVIQVVCEACTDATFKQNMIHSQSTPVHYSLVPGSAFRPRERLY